MSEGKTLIVVGTYERFLLGYDVSNLSESSGSFQRAFTHAAHQKAVKCMAAGGPYLATGGADDQIHLYDMRDRKDLGFLMNPGEGAVPCLEFYTAKGAHTPSHMFSGSADGLICVWKAGGGWEHLKKMGGHQGPVNSLTVHQTGRVALSVGHDRTLRIWNLVKGRLTYTARIEVEGDTIKFGPSGEAYALLAGPKVTVHSTGNEGKLLATLQPTRRPTCFLQHSDDSLLLGAEDGSIQLWDVRTSAMQQRLDRAHTARVRAMSALGSASAPGGGLPLHLASASSDGVVKLWDTRMMGGNGTLTCLAQADTNARITCLCAWQPPPPPVQRDAKQPGRAAAKRAAPGDAAAAGDDAAAAPAPKKKSKAAPGDATATDGDAAAAPASKKKSKAEPGDAPAAAGGATPAPTKKSKAAPGSATATGGDVAAAPAPKKKSKAGAQAQLPQTSQPSGDAQDAGMPDAGPLGRSAKGRKHAAPAAAELGPSTSSPAARDGSKRLGKPAHVEKDRRRSHADHGEDGGGAIAVGSPAVHQQRGRQPNRPGSGDGGAGGAKLLKRQNQITAVARNGGSPAANTGPKKSKPPRS